MSTIQRSVLTGCASIVLSSMIALTAFADDLEIYLGTGSSAVTYNPNVLFIMDTSGSMGAKDGTSESRMLRVQNALKDALNSATNINAGLMRFSDFGGPVLYPVRGIDDPVLPEIITSTATSNDDAYEINSAVNVTSNQLILTQGTDTVHSGFRYQDLNIPRGATITNAFIRLTSGQLNTSSSTLTIRAEKTGDSTAFSTSNRDISDRTTTTNEVVWDTDNDFPLSEESIVSPSLVDVIQEVVDQSTWCGGNSLNILIEGTSSDGSSNRRALSNDEGTGLSPQLVLSYDDSSATGCVKGRLTYQVNANQNNAEERSNGYESTGSELTFRDSANDYVGVRFNNINLPQGATITNAFLEFTAYQTSTGSASMRIEGVNEDDPNDFSPYYRYMLRNKPKTVGVNWSNIPAFYKNNVYTSPPVTAIVQQIVNRSGWRPNYEMMFVFSDFDGSRGAYTYKGKPSGSVRLIVEYQGNAVPGTTATVRQHLVSKVDELSASGFTPIVDTLFEASQYYGGDDVYYGLARGTNSVSSTVRKNTRVSHRASYVGADSVRPFGCTEDNLSDSDCINEYIPSGAEYISPITDLQCQTNNHIVLLSDGEANNNHSVDEIEALLGKSCTGSGGEKCGIDLVKNISNSNDSKIDARVITHTIGFAANSTANNFLNNLAIQSGGGFYTADNSADLVEAFQTILRSVKDVNATFVSPGVAVNQLNRLTHRDELYFALFKPSEGTIWPGNLKKYKINGDKVLDKNGLDAVDSVTGFFAENSHSYWSTLSDGNDVREGGAASKVTLSRNIYAFENPGNIATSGNRLHESNSSITEQDLLVESLSGSSVVRDTVLKWARGVDVRDDDGDGSTSDERLQMGDPIHSQPVIVNYSATDSAILVATNHGFLHSIDAQTGTENWAIIPKELLANLHDLYRDTSTFNHIYGLDGDMVLRTVGSKTYLYVGMRRGGNNYYAFDVTSKASPKLVFTIEGGSTGFESLGQTWSRPTITKINMGGSVRNVMIFGGGYDDDQDDKLVRSPDAVGNAVYIVDADTGALLWTASNAGADLNLPAMQYSVPARISVIDRDNDGFADHMYVADTGGQLFRLDIYNGESGSDLIKGALMAEFGGNTAEENRRFYYGPDVSEVALGDELYYAVALGTGFRAGPLDTTIEDRFYMLKDTGVFSIDANGDFTLPTTPYQQSDLYDATNHLLTSSDSNERDIASNALANKDGWMLQLTTGGEKVLSSPLILDYKIFFTTYVPASSSTSSCAPPTGNSRAYLVNLLNANAVDDLNQTGELDSNDRFAQLKQTGIAPDTKILIEDIVEPVVCLGTECVSAVISVDNNGNEIACGSDFECLARNIYGRFERVQRSSWETEVERD
ncbi:pilus assembly protein PilY [Alteromonas sp. SM 2104]|nr:pilus assembly protein PilY [Alteromonas oceanisediminis]